MTPPILIIGAGPAGLAAAEAASRDGQAVVVIDENSAPGGQIWRGGAPYWKDARAQALWDMLTARPQVRVLCGTRVVGSAGPGELLLESEGKPRSMPWQRVIICSGARELLLPFPGWTLPGVTGAGAMQALIKGGMPIAGKRVVVAGSGPLLLAVADTVRKNGGIVVALAEHRGTRELAGFAGRLARTHQRKFFQAVKLFAGLRGVPYLRGTSVQAARGNEALESVAIGHRGGLKELACDFLACGFGLVPALEGAALFGCAVGQGKVMVDSAQRTSVEGVWAAGESTGIGGVDKALAEGRVAGLAATGKTPSPADLHMRDSANAFARLLADSFAPAPALRAMCDPSTIVCRCEDVRAVELMRHTSWRSAKLQTRAGMGACQGRVCGAACEFLYGWEAAGARPPVFPTSAATLASVSK